MHYESIDVGLFLKNFLKRFAAAVTSLGVYADKLWVRAGVAFLQGCRELERVGRNHSVIMVGSSDKRGGVGCAGLEVMQRGVTI